MFGYIRPWKPELKMKEFALYKAVYCGLCRELGKGYGLPARFMLNYDATFFCLLALSLRQERCGFGKTRCPANPLRRCDAAAPAPALSFWADVTVLLFCEKIEDDRHDAGLSGRAAALLLRPWAAFLRRRAAKRSPQAAELIGGFARRQLAAERGRGASLDAAADPTASLVAGLLRAGSEGAQARVLERLGYFLGRWSYLADAADDLERDLKNGDYNPFAAACGVTREMPLRERREILRPALTICISEALTAFALLECRRDAPLLGNVLGLGLPKMEEAVLSALPKKQRREKFAELYRL